MALGADKRDVLRMMVKEGLRIATAGMVIGLGGALWVTRVLRSLIYGIESTDTVTFAVVCAIVGASAFLASYLPARRAVSVDPMMALRRE